MEGWKDGSVTISLRNFVGEGIINKDWKLTIVNNNNNNFKQFKQKPSKLTSFPSTLLDCKHIKHIVSKIWVISSAETF